SRHLVLDTARIKALKQAHQHRTEAIIDFITNTRQCRTQIMLRYFGQEYNKQCGHCDYCNTAEPVTNKELESAILKLVAEHETINILTLNKLLAPHDAQAITYSVRQLIDSGRLNYNNIGST